MTKLFTCLSIPPVQRVRDTASYTQPSLKGKYRLIQNISTVTACKGTAYVTNLLTSNQLKASNVHAGQVVLP